jgi:hypothetical protein
MEYSFLGFSFAPDLVRLLGSDVQFCFRFMRIHGVSYCWVQLRFRLLTCENCSPSVASFILQSPCKQLSIASGLPLLCVSRWMNSGGSMRGSRVQRDLPEASHCATMGLGTTTIPVIWCCRD